MNLNYLKNEIIPQREKEIAEGKNLGTRQPIYVVLDLTECFVSGHSDYSSNTNKQGKPFEYGYIDMALDFESREFRETDKEIEKPEAVTKLYFDRVIAFFLISKGAHEYLEYQKHNLTNPYVYVFYSGYGNIEMDNLLQNK
jgi:hypothetical protein